VEGAVPSTVALKGSEMSHTGTITKTQVNLGLTEPPMFKIIYLNDNATPMDFVMDTLIESFDYTTETAEKITMDIHTEGSAVVAVLPYEIAEQKGIEVTVQARHNNYPLQIKLEPETA
jgi:ATP-dependent Clp protease adaptor protein ClpS